MTSAVSDVQPAPAPDAVRPGPTPPLRSAGADGRLRMVRDASFLFPAVAVVAVVLLVPFGITVYRSLFSDSLHSTFVGVQQYGKVFQNPALLHSLVNTLIWVIGSLLLPVGLGLAVAVMTSAMRLGALARMAIVLPYAMSGTAIAVVGNFLLRSDGAVNQALRAIGLDSWQQSWLLSWPLNTVSAILVSTWQSTGVAVVLFMVGLQTIPPETIEAAALDGAAGWQRFRFVVFPQLRAVTMVVVGITLANALKSFDVIFVLTSGGGPARSSETLAVSMYRETFVLNHSGVGAATAVLLTAIVLAASWVYLRGQLRTGR